jgi:uncharacterized protein (TIGR02145 family)
MKVYALIATLLLTQKISIAQIDLLKVNPIEIGNNITKISASKSFYLQKGNHFNILLHSEENTNSESVIPPGSVLIGKQIWMSVNLNVSKFRDGSPIPKVTDASNWMSTATPAYCYYNNDSLTNSATFGKLYNWAAVNDKRGLCPTGWHVPSLNEWKILEATLGGANVAGGKMKTVGNKHWDNPNVSASNSSGFKGLPGGYRFFNGNFGSINSYGLWWSSTEVDGSSAWYKYLFNSMSSLVSSSNFKQYGFSVRCIKD